MKQIWIDFKAFAMKGNMIDLAVGVIIGAAFGKVVNSLVENILMPPLGLLIGGVDFSQLKIVLKEAPSEVAIGYGVFIQNVVNFLIVAWALFLLIKLMMRLHLEQKAKPTPTPEDVLLLREIRDSLKNKK